MNYTIKQFNADYPDDDACLQELFEARYGNLEWCPNCGGEAKFYKLKNRKCYSCQHCRYQLHPLAKTIFHKSRTPLQSWFFIMYLFHTSRNGVSAMEIQRHLNVRYKTALRMGRQIRQLMKQGNDMLAGITEVDECYIGGRRRSTTRYENKVPVLGAVQRKGKVRVAVTDHANATTAMGFVKANVKTGSVLNTDGSKLYSRAHKLYDHRKVEHGVHEYVRDDDYTNTVEGFWGLLKPSLNGTYRVVSKTHLQSYVNEFVYRYNLRGEVIWPALLEQAARPV